MAELLSPGAPSVQLPLPDLPFRELGLADLPALLDLGADRGWAREERKWQLLMQVGTVYGADAPDGGGLAAALALTRYGTRLAAIGMVLTAARYARRGLGRRAMRHALAAAEGAVVTLHATDNGRPLYEQLGFRTVATAPMRRGVLTPDTAVDTSRVRPARATDLGTIRELDLAVFGADRTALLTRLPAFCGQLLVAEGGGRLLGFAGTWQTVGSTVIGPVVADSTATAKALISVLAAATEGPLRLDVDSRHAELCAWLQEHGLREADWRQSVMVYGAEQAPGDLARRFVPVTVAL
ncbi:GNAT family N-acetyltransferase [Streptomyces polyrhachis]|uniref:GNAT family N-acetyltransferase n=1 Tax=Streptomyces polyrhachis TaxID=1282885 RepID=A0ABW2GDP6_9ACTN